MTARYTRCLPAASGDDLPLPQERQCSLIEFLSSTRSYFAACSPRRRWICRRNERTAPSNGVLVGIQNLGCRIVTEVVGETLEYNRSCFPGTRSGAGVVMTQQQDARQMLDRAERAATAGDLASADELLRGAARIQEEELGPLHPDLANTLNNLAIVAEKAGRPDDAETLDRKSVVE